MKKLSSLIILLIISVTSVSQNFNVNTGYNTVELIESLLKNYMNYSNPTSSGDSLARGHFYGTSNLGMDQGVILSTGRAIDAVGPNNSGSTSTNMIGQTSDPDIQLIVGSSTYDASVLEFDFITSKNDSLIFASFCFGSEEYPEYIDGPFTDGAGIFVSGPGISGSFSNDAENLAQLPDIMPPVYISVFNINEDDYSQYYSENTEQYLQYDGFVTRITNYLSVLPNETYHMKIVVADAVDALWDSGFFIEQESIGTSPFRVFSTIEHDQCGHGLGSISLQVEGYYPPFQYQWSTGDSTSSIDSLFAGEYYVDITDVEGFSLRDTFQIQSFSSPPEFYYNFTYFEDECLTEVTAHIDGIMHPYSYFWNDTAQQTTQTAVLCPGSYNLMVVDSISCEYYDDVEVIYDPDYSFQVGMLDNTASYAESIVPDGCVVTNATLLGSVNAIGSFSGQSNIDFEDGIILSTGLVWTAEGPNETDSTGFLFNTPGDPDLELLAGSEVHDAAILEFDFTSIHDSVNFYYVFASEEYNELVEEEHPDVLGFFVSGAGLAGPFNNNAKNFAKVPGIDIPLNVTSVNNGFSVFGIPPSGPCTNCDFYIYNDEHYISFDGFTTIQEVSVPVIYNETYHARIAIADAIGRNYNSGILIKSGEGEFTSINNSNDLSNNSYSVYYYDHNIFIKPYDISKNYRFFLCNINGSIVYEGLGFGKYLLSCNDFNNGIYVLKIVDDETSYSKKLILQ